MVRTLECPNCGGSVQLKYERTINAVCIQCLSILDASAPSLQIIQKFESAQRYQPKIPLGARGKLTSGQYEAIGFQIRSINVDGVTYQWSEYLLYNPYQGYRYLTEYNGHWNEIRTLRALPVPSRKGAKEAAIYDGKTYTHFQTAEAQTVFVMGEFPWQVRVGETVQVKDYVAPPDTISSEESAGEVVWSVGRYTAGKEIWKAFNLKSSPPSPLGVYANQPSPYQGRVVSAWKTLVLLACILVITMVAVGIMAPRQEVFQQRYVFSSGAGEPSFVTPIFALGRGESNVEVTVKTDLENDWVFFSMALINSDTGDAYDFGEEISYYHGRDSDGTWSEGGKNESASLTGIPGGNYYLRIEPEMEKDGRPHFVSYDVLVERGKPAYFWFVPAFLLLLIPPVVTSIRAFGFENRRWAESDYGAIVSSSGDDDD